MKTQYQMLKQAIVEQCYNDFSPTKIEKVSEILIKPIPDILVKKIIRQSGNVPFSQSDLNVSHLKNIVVKEIVNSEVYYPVAL